MPPIACIDGVDPERLARIIPTPFHAYSVSAITDRITRLQAALAGLDAHVRYAVKANSNLALLRLIGASGCGADIVSAGELERCLHAGIPPERIVFSGVGKTLSDITTALVTGVECMNVESMEELQTIERIAAAQGRTARVALRINPEVDAGTHAKITTGTAENKFGITIAAARHCFEHRGDYPHLQIDGLHVHIGSQILSLAPFRRAFAQVAAFAEELESAGHAIASLDVGGGLSVRYHPDDTPPSIADYVAVVRDAFARFHGRLLFEPGRWLVAEAGVLVTRVLRVKTTATRRFVIVDAAMNDFARPSLYDAWHAIEPVRARPGPVQPCDIVGPVCETGDTFATARQLPPVATGDLLLIRATGAYGASMGSNYNSRPAIAEVLLREGQWALARRRQRFEEMIACESTVCRWENA